MSRQQYWLDVIVSRAKRRGFIYPGSEIYGGLANAWDYGPYGSQLKKNIADARWKFFVQEREDMIGMDTAILAHPRTREASGHVWWFSDALIDDKKTGQRFRADKIIEASIEAKIERFWADSVEQYIRNTYKVDNLIPESRWFEKMHQYIIGEKIKNPDTKKEADWTDIRSFNLMLYTYLWPIHDEANKVRIRPETCQSLFTNFKNICDTTRLRIPFGMAQIGKAFRNEITPWQFLFRTREFEQMEIEYFVENDEQKALAAQAMWQDLSKQFWLDIIKLNPENIRFREQEKDELAHYAKKTFDVEYKFPRWRGELQGLAYRTDFDLTQHQKFSGKDMQYHDPKTGKRYIPHVIEPSFGLSRTVMTVMLDCYDEEQLDNGEQRVVVRFPFDLAPIKFAIFPLMEKNEEMFEFSRNVFVKLSKQYFCEFDASGNIGKRYRRQDEIGTPYCVTIDQQTLQDQTVTLRYRDSMNQIRITIQDLIDGNIARE